MNHDTRIQDPPFWSELKKALEYLSFFEGRNSAGETFGSQPVCQRIAYVQEVDRVLASFSRSQLPDGLCLGDLKLGKAQAVFRAYLGCKVDVIITKTEVYFGIPVERAKVSELTRT